MITCWSYHVFVSPLNIVTIYLYLCTQPDYVYVPPAFFVVHDFIIAPMSEMHVCFKTVKM